MFHYGYMSILWVMIGTVWEKRVLHSLRDLKCNQGHSKTCSWIFISTIFIMNLQRLWEIETLMKHCRSLFQKDISWKTLTLAELDVRQNLFTIGLQTKKQVDMFIKHSNKIICVDSTRLNLSNESIKIPIGNTRCSRWNQ